MPPIPRPESSVVFERLLRGEATSQEYVDALRAEARQRAKDRGELGFTTDDDSTGQW